MKFQIAKSDLESALQVVSASLSSSGNDISTHYLFRVVDTEGEAKVEVLTYSGRVFSACPLKVTLESRGTGAFTVEGKRLNQWLVPAEGVLTFEATGPTIKATSARTWNTFQSLDPSAFPYWDKIQSDATESAKISAKKLASALEYSKPFISDREATNPDLCVCEFKNGILYSTDQRAATLVRVPGLEKSNLRIHGKDVGGFLTFLGACKDGEVTLLEHDKALFLRRWDGAVFGESRFQTAFPGLKINMDDTDQRAWKIHKDTIQMAIQNLSAGAAWEDNKMRFAFTPKNGSVTLSMMSMTDQETTHEVPCIEANAQENAPALPEGGFLVDRESLRKVLSAWENDGVDFGVNVAGSRGFLRFVSEGNGNKYLTVIAWLRP